MLIITINEKVSDILKSIKAFGSITVETSPFACAKISSKKTRQAQISAPNRMHLINTISMELNRKFKTIYGCPRGCAMTQNGLYIFPDSSGSRLAATNAQGKTEYTTQMSTPSRIYSVFDVELINDNTLAVTTGDPRVFGQRGVLVLLI